MKLPVAILGYGAIRSPSCLTIWGIPGAHAGPILLAEMDPGRPDACLIWALGILRDIDPLLPVPIWRFLKVIPVRPWEHVDRRNNVGHLFSLDVTGRTLEVDWEGEPITISFGVSHEHLKSQISDLKSPSVPAAEIPPVVIGYLPEEMVHPPPAGSAGPG